MGNSKEKQGYRGPISPELSKKLKPFTSSLGDDVLINDLRKWKKWNDSTDPKKPYPYPKWKEIMETLEPREKAATGTMLQYIVSNDQHATVGYVRTTDVKILARISNGSPEQPSYLGPDRAKFLKGLFT